MTQPRQPPRIVSCSGKEALDASRAKQIAREMRRRDRNADAYRCQHCSAWHVGSHSTKRLKTRPRKEADE